MLIFPHSNCKTIFVWIRLNCNDTLLTYNSDYIIVCQRRPLMSVHTSLDSVHVFLLRNNWKLRTLNMILNHSHFASKTLNNISGVELLNILCISFTDFWWTQNFLWRHWFNCWCLCPWGTWSKYIFKKHWCIQQ